MKSVAAVVRCLFVLASLAAPAIADETIAILPPQVTLSGPGAQQRVLVERINVGGYNRAFGKQLSSGVEWKVSDPAVVKIEAGVLTPLANGKATLTATSDGQSATAEVEVVGMQQPHEWGFRNHVEAVLAKAGCNSGACHGALAGKGGFKLSLRGYDPENDYQIITRQARGRRVELSDPGSSLILAKPSGGLPHKGGVRFEVDSFDYRVIADWISHGAKPPAADDPRLERLAIWPEQSVLSLGDTAQIVVQGHYSDGHVEDVTRWVKFATTNQAVAKVDDAGLVTVQGHGEGAITAWFGSKIALARVAAPYAHSINPEVFAKAGRRNFIDELVLAKLASLNLPPSPPATDEEFVRRVYLDTIGVLPTIDEVKAFLADAGADKRDRLIETLLARPEFIDYWTYKWSDLLLLSGKRLRPEPIKAFYGWIRKSVEANKPWDQFAREVVTSKGSSFENGATNFYALHQDAFEMTENTSQAFLGLSIACARCHNHPLEKWTNNQYYAMANLFARVRAKGWGGDFRNGDGLRTVYVAAEGDLIQPATGKPQPPTPLDGQPLAMDAPEDRRIALAAWLTAPENPYFSRAVTNRVWANFFGVGLVESIDDLRASNPASNEELLAATAKYLVDNKYDLKSLMRVILQSNTYQRSSQPLPENKDEQRFYSRYYPRRLMAEVMLDAISQATAAPTTFKDYPAGTRAMQLPDASVDSYFLKTFGRPERIITCECERSAEPSMVQILHISNGDTINGKLQAAENRLSKAIAAAATPEQIIDEAYLAALSRYPTADEKTRLLAIVTAASDADKRAVLEDVYWSILSSREFLFNH